jgi:hypothetical protein
MSEFYEHPESDEIYPAEPLKRPFSANTRERLAKLAGTVPGMAELIKESDALLPDEE